MHSLAPIKPINPNAVLQFSWLSLVLSRGMSFSGWLSECPLTRVMPEHLSLF